MRKFLVFGTLAIFITGMWGCKAFKGAAVTAKPDPLEVHADSISYSIRASVPPKSAFKKGGVYSGEGMIGTRSQQKVVISTDKYPKIKKTGVDTTINLKKAYFDDMDGNDLKVKQSYERRGKEFELPDIENLAQCCITTSRLVWENDQFLFTNNEYQKEVPLNLTAKFQFPKDVFAIQEGDYSKSDISAIGEFVKAKKIATKITIEGFASPEGPYKRNVMLSIERLKQVQTWLTAQLQEAGYEQYLDSNFFQLSTTAQDWEGFKAGLNVPADVRTQVIEIISAGLSEDQKEAQIMALVGGKDKVESILAPLRRATVRVEGFEPRRTDAEIDKIAADFIAGKFDGTLKTTYEKEEWLYAISRVSDIDGKRMLLEGFREAYPSDFRAFNDLGAIYLKQGDLKKGTEMLEGAEKLKSGDAAISNNLGVAYKAKGNYKQALALYQNSLGAKSSGEANFNLGVVLEKMARYADAVEKFNAAASIEGSSYNAGLCKLLNNDLAGAKANLGEAIKAAKDEAWPYYVMAIAGARASDASTMTVNLKKACELDGNMKEKARKDLEFRKMWSSPEFKAATK